MKKVSFFMLLLCLCVLCPRIDAQEAFGWNLHDEQAPENVGPCKFDIGNPSSFQILRTHDFGICAGAFAGKKYYAYTYQSTVGGSKPLAFGTYDFATGAFSQIADYSGMTTLFYDMAYDYKNSIMYALGKKGNVSLLLKVNLSDGQVTTIAELDQEFVALAVNLQGEILVEDIYGYLNKLELDGTVNAMNSCEYTPELQFQSMAINHATEKLYWIIPTSREGTQILEIDATTGFCDNNSELANNRQIVGLDFPHSNVKDGAPGIVEPLEVIPATAGSKEVTINLTAPKNTSGGGTLGAVTIHVLRGSEEILAKENVQPGEKITLNDNVPHDGLYTYKAYASNSEGSGEETIAQLYLGEDVPDAVTNIQLAKQANGRDCIISWTAPQKGVEGGYIPENLKYEIVRLPDSVTIARDIEATTVTDNTVTRLGSYQYQITPTGREKGKSSLSPAIVLGTAHAIPYSCKFTDEDMPLWTIIDNNNDGITWKRRMVKEGISCLYSDDKVGDDWIVSRPIALKGNTKYKVVVTASSYDRELVEKMNLYFGQGDKPENLSTFQQVAQFEVANDEGGQDNYIAYFTPVADSLLNFAIQMNSDPGKYQLEVLSLLIKEASEGALQGKVTHQGTAIEGVEVSLKDSPFNTKTNAQGEWTINHIPEANYTLEARKEGFALYSQPVQVVEEESSTINIELRPIEQVTASGKVTYMNGQALPDAQITLQAIDGTAAVQQQVVFSDREGNYKLPNTYEGTYELSFVHPGLKPHALQVNIAKDATALPDIELKDKPVAPRLVNATAHDNVARAQWSKPVDVDTLSYYQGPGVARIGVFSFTPRSIVGTVFRKDMAITSIKWQTDEYRGPHKSVDLVIFALNEAGDPTSNIIYEKKDIANIDNQWCSYELEQPLVVKGGALVAFRYNGYLSVLADAGENGGLHFEPRVHVINSDYETADFEYLDKHDMNKNLLIGIDYTLLNATATAPAATLQQHKQYKVYRRLEKEGEDWKYLASTDAAVQQYDDAQFGTLPMGYYRYGVASVLSSGEESGKATSALVGKNMLANVKFAVKPNAALPATPPAITLKPEKDNSVSFTAVKVDNTTWTIENIAKGKYALTAQLDGFDDIVETLEIEGEEKDFTCDLNFTERLLPAYNLKAEKQGEAGKRLLTWNRDNYIFDDFESYEPFTVEPATKEMNWIYWDKDKDNTVEFENITFKFMGIPMTYMAFNPFATTPALAYFDQGALPYSGSQYLASFGNRSKANQDFVFSPIINYTGKATFSCVIKSFSNQLGMAAVKVGYTEKEYPKLLEDIVWLSETMTINDKNWQELVVEVPEKARRMVLLNETPKGFFLMIDNLFVGEESPYADGKVKKPAVDRATYEVQLDGTTVEGVDQENHEVMLQSLTTGTHTAQVTATYESGRSVTKSITFEVSETSGVDNVALQGQLSIYPNPATHMVHTTEGVESWTIIDMNGAFIGQGTEHDIDVSSLSRGIYIMRLNGMNRNAVVKLIKQ